MPKLVVIPTNPIQESQAQSAEDRVIQYFNPAAFFDDVFVFSPFETREYDRHGFHVIPGRDKDLPGIIQKFKIDVVRAYGGHWPCDMACFYRVSGVPAVVSIHDMRPQLLRPSVVRADVVLCVSQNVRNLVLRFYKNPERVWLRPNGVDLDVMRPLPSPEFRDLNALFSCSKRILHVGRKSLEKNLETLIRVLVRLPSDYGLVAIGPGNESPYRNLAQEVGVLDRCLFIQSIPNQDLSRYYNWADCMCLPSHSEAMSNVILEAFACGTASILSEAAAKGVGAVDNREAIVFEKAEDVESLASGIRRVVEDKMFAQGLVQEARKIAEKYERKEMEVAEARQYQTILNMQRDGVFRINTGGFVSLYVENLKRRVVQKTARVSRQRHSA